MHVLLVEPDVIQARLTREVLERDGHEVTHALSAQAAVHAADEQAPDVVVLELQMPRHNGIEFLYEFRSYYEWLHIPIIVYSFVPPRELAQAATLKNELGVVCVLYKPQASLEALRTAVRTATAVAP